MIKMNTTMSNIDFQVFQANIGQNTCGMRPAFFKKLNQSISSSHIHILFKIRIRIPQFIKFSYSQPTRVFNSFTSCQNKIL